MSTETIYHANRHAQFNSGARTARTNICQGTQNPGEAISAVKALQIANVQGQRIYHITHDNQTSILGNIYHDQVTMDEIKMRLM